MSERKVLVRETVELMGSMKAKLEEHARTLTEEGIDRTRPGYNPTEDEVWSAFNSVDVAAARIKNNLIHIASLPQEIPPPNRTQ